MDTTRFDEIASSFAQIQNRRSILRTLGAAVVGAGALGVFAQAEGDAKRRKGKKGKKGKGGNGGGNNDRCLKSGDFCKNDEQCCPNSTKRICEVPQNAGNSDKTCCGGQGAVCGGVNEDGDFVGPLCCIGEAGVRSFVCSSSDPNNPFVPGTCIPAPPEI